MARSIYCSRCKLEKEPGRENQSYCQACRTAQRLEKKAASNIPRLPKGVTNRKKRDYGSGPQPDCLYCGKIKEDIRQSRCNSCRREYNRKWTRATGRVQKHQTNLCPCGAERSPGQSYFCLSCKAEESRRWRLRHRKSEAELSKAKIERMEMAKFKYYVRKVTQEYIRRGILIRLPCEVCGSNEDVEAHHDDYNKPMDVRWLCRIHHIEHHKTVGRKKLNN